MNISTQLATKIRDTLRARPLDEGECRRIEGSGELYIAYSEPAQEGYRFKWLYDLDIDAKTYKLFARFTNE